MEKLDLLINKKIEVIWEKQSFKSNIQDVNEKFFYISIPTKDGEYIPLRSGDLAEVMYYQELSIFQFDSRVIGRKVDGIPLIILEIPNTYKVVQRRQYYRVVKLDYLTVINFEKLPEGEGYKSKIPKKQMDISKVSQKVVLLDLSGGGMRIKVEQPIQYGDILHFILNTLKGDIEIYGKVVRVERDEKNFYVCGINFLDLTNLEREKIIQYTFEIMRNQRSKGL
ncbi:MAG: flagellar brake domain-containing protein [Clostridiaceae bacterium]|nr:flagellar brake domain-containing protein [Clostridiaceae bacterium]